MNWSKAAKDRQMYGVKERHSVTRTRNASQFSSNYDARADTITTKRFLSATRGHQFVPLEEVKARLLARKDR